MTKHNGDFVTTSACHRDFMMIPRDHDDSVRESEQINIMMTSLLKSSDIPSTTLSKPYLVKVPICCPATRAQYEESSFYWPVTFHEDKR